MFCVPKKYTRAFEKAFRPNPDNPSEKGPLHPDNLRKMSPDERRAAIKSVIGVDDEFARQVNLKYEKQLLLKDQKKAMTNFINDIQGLNPVAKKDLVDQVLGLQTAISPKDARGFLEDFTARRLGATVSHEEASEMLSMAKKADETKKAWKDDLDNEDKRKAFGVDLVRLNDYTNSLKGNNMTGWDKALNIFNLPKHAAATLDLSATLVQLSSMITSGRFWEGFIEQFKYAWDEEHFEKLRGDIITHPYYELSQKAKLGLGNIADKLKPNEEYLQSSLLEDANAWLKNKSGGLVPNAIRGADRAFIGYVNYVRFKTFTDLVDAAKLRGEDMTMGSPAVRDIAENINTFTGRGNVGIHDAYGNAVPFINAFTWTIRKVTSTLTLLSPVPFMKASPTARIFAMRQMMGYLTATASLYGSARMVLGADAVPTDPSDVHFGWIKVGNTWFNPLGDRPTYARLWWRLATGRTINAAGVESRYGRSLADMVDGNDPKITDRNTTRASLLGRFSEAKLNPTASILLDAFAEKDYMGNPVGWNKESVEREINSRFYPMSLASYVDVIQNDPKNTVGQVLAMSSIFGASTYVDVPRSRQGLTAWGDSLADTYQNKETDLVNKKLLDINQDMKFPPKTINGVKLTDKQYHDYITVFGQAAKQQLMEAVNSGEWDNSTDEEKKEGWKNSLKIARKMAGTALMLNSQNNNDGENNPIFDQMQPSNTDGTDARSNVMRLDKAKDTKVKNVLTAPVSTEAEMRQQWAKLQVQDYDYGKLQNTNPLAYLGFQAAKKDGIAHLFKTPVTALGLTFETNESKPKNPEEEADYPIVHRLLQEAGVKDDEAAGKILLGPEFSKGTDTYTLEHELMHKGLLVLKALDPNKITQDPVESSKAFIAIHNNEPLLQLWRIMHGEGGHSSPNAVEPHKYLNDNAPRVLKDMPFYDDIMKSTQALAKKVTK